MQLGMIGLGRMGANMVLRLIRAGHQCVVYDRDASSVACLVQEGAEGASDLKDFCRRLSTPRNIWIMVPAAAVDRVIDDLVPHLTAGDIIVDGGNSNYRNDIAHTARLAPAGIHFVDCGTSGGVWGLDRGYCLMIGGDTEAVRAARPHLRGPSPGGRGDRAHRRA